MPCMGPAAPSTPSSGLHHHQGGARQWVGVVPKAPTQIGNSQLFAHFHYSSTRHIRGTPAEFQTDHRNGGRRGGRSKTARCHRNHEFSSETSEPTRDRIDRTTGSCALSPPYRPEHIRSPRPASHAGQRPGLAPGPNWGCKHHRVSSTQFPRSLPAPETRDSSHRQSRVPNGKLHLDVIGFHLPRAEMPGTATTSRHWVSGHWSWSWSRLPAQPSTHLAGGAVWLRASQLNSNSN